MQPSSQLGSTTYLALCGPACLPLLGLLAASLRLSLHELAGEGVRQHLYRGIAHKVVMGVTCLLVPANASSSFLCALLRGHTLHAAGRQLAALAGSPEAAAATATAAAAAEDQGEPAPINTANYATALLNLVYILVAAACKVCLTVPAPEAQQLQEELVAALEGSQGADDGAAQAFASRLRDVASGRCARHAALCLGLAVLCDADGGPALGMPPELLAVLPAVLPAYLEGPAAGSGIMSAEAVTQLRGMASMLSFVGTAPPGRRGALALMLRVGWLAVDSARALAAVDRGGSSRSAGGLAAGVPRRIVAAGDIFAVALDALKNAWFLPLASGAPEGDTLRATETAGWWQLAAAIVADVLPYATADAHLTALGGLLHLPQGRLLARRGVLSLPPKPPPEVAAALEGGLLRCLERLLRRAGRDPQGREVAMLRRLGRLGDGSLWPYLAPLMAYGEPRQAAALVATLRKLLRTVDLWGMLAAWSEWASKKNSYGGFLQALYDILYEAPLADAVPEEGLSSASQQLLRLLSCAASDWLPVVAQAVLSADSAEERSAGVPLPILKWLQLLAACCAAQPGMPASSPPAYQADRGAAAISGAVAGPVNRGEAAADGGGEATADDVRGAAAGDGGWRALLLEEVGRRVVAAGRGPPERCRSSSRREQ
ncbi:hypothetical protein GPECTOR_29g132 [Gonium pectorale]|uniref:Uncharacterized protein n=1 Tax=Gonium pectorale TaxID=33097 RepID=A0A150GEI6_GONPE|nr:hypothetical protein GPECTOR_29g132 [Gonium pectorale]|eukprot:KXZ48228.1 hypothetical protein GPECTOR_29g132 [Gonium pectorale]